MTDRKHGFFDGKLVVMSPCRCGATIYRYFEPGVPGIRYRHGEGEATLFLSIEEMVRFCHDDGAYGSIIQPWIDRVHEYEGVCQ